MSAKSNLRVVRPGELPSIVKSLDMPTIGLVVETLADVPQESAVWVQAYNRWRPGIVVGRTRGTSAYPTMETRVTVTFRRINAPKIDPLETRAFPLHKVLRRTVTEAVTS